MVRRTLIVLGTALVCAWPAAAHAGPILVLGPGGHVTASQDPFLPPADLSPAPAPAHSHRAGATGLAHAARARPHRKPRHRRPGPKPPAAIISARLVALERSGAITPQAYSADLATVVAAARTESRLHGTRAIELGAVLATIAHFAAGSQFTPERLPALMLTLDRNREWWSTGSLLAYGDRVEFTGSELVWEYYPGQGIQLQPLASFGKADGLYTAGPAYYPELQQLLGELIGLAVTRAGATAWEYYFAFDGGNPPWTSAMTQGTALEALTRGYEALGDASYLSVAHSALALFQAPPPTGVEVPTAHGARYVQYSFAAGTSILNAFLQSLIGLYDYAHVSGDATATGLFAAGSTEALAELPAFDTGAWSLYQPGIEDTLDYHQLVTGFLAQLCTRTAAPGYCQEAQHFQSYLRTPPVLTLRTTRLHRKRPGTVVFELSKYSHVGIVMTCGGRTVLYTSADFAYGTDAFAVQAPSRGGACSVRLGATDLAGNFARIQGSITIR